MKILHFYLVGQRFQFGNYILDLISLSIQLVKQKIIIPFSLRRQDGYFGKWVKILKLKINDALASIKGYIILLMFWGHTSCHTFEIEQGWFAGKRLITVRQLLEGIVENLNILLWNQGISWRAQQGIFWGPKENV